MLLEEVRALFLLPVVVLASNDLFDVYKKHSKRQVYPTILRCPRPYCGKDVCPKLLLRSSIEKAWAACSFPNPPPTDEDQLRLLRWSGIRLPENLALFLLLGGIGSSIGSSINDNSSTSSSSSSDRG